MESSPFIRTERLILREFNASDIALIFELDSNSAVMEFIRPPSKTLQEAEATYNKIVATRQRDKRFGNWVAVTINTHEAIGWFCLKDLDNTSAIEVGFRLLPRFWGYGYATEGAKALIDYGFTVCNLNTIVGVTTDANLRSQSALTKCGLQFIKHARFYETDVKYYAIEKQTSLI
ncbi:MAG: GNAT family N-acetyltransferase [Bacteroidetes bacterium]|nr:GNAT family N-acetyltransferase [Bacteroidota bacterium]